MATSPGFIESIEGVDDVLAESESVAEEAQIARLETDAARESAAVVDLVPRIEERTDRHPVAVYLARLGTEGSRGTMRAALEQVVREIAGEAMSVRDFPWASLRYPHLQALRAEMATRLAPATVNLRLSAVRGVLREAWKLGLITTDDHQRIASVEGVRGSRLPTGRDVSMSERQRLLDACLADPLPARGARDAALLGLLAGTGVRRAEAVAADLEHVELDTGKVRVLGKGNKERLVYLVEGAQRALERWLSLRGSEPGALFYRVRRGGHIHPKRLTPQAVRYVVERRVHEVGLRDASPHDFRRTVCGDLLDAGADLPSVQALLGHASPTTTARYDRRGERARKKAAKLIRVPYSARGEGRKKSS